MSGRFYGFDFPPEFIGGDSINDCAKECDRLENKKYRCKIMKLLLNEKKISLHDLFKIQFNLPADRISRFMIMFKKDIEK